MYYSSTVVAQGFAHIPAPLHSILQKQQPYDLTLAAEQAFQQLRQALIEAPVLAYQKEA